MSTSNRPSPLSANAILESLERVATVICHGQPLESIISLALTEMRLLLHSDRILLGQHIVETEGSEYPRAPFSEMMPLGPAGLSSKFKGKPSPKLSSQHGSLWRGHPQTNGTPSNIPIHISHESLGSTISSCLHQRLVLESEWLKCPHIWNEMLIVVPIWIQQKLWGTLMVQKASALAPEYASSPEPVNYRFIDNRQGADIEFQLIQGMATQLAIAIQQTQLRQEIQRQTDGLDQLNYLKEEFLSTISHELRTPMSSIKMATEMMDRMLRTTVQPDMQQKLQNYVQILQNETDREIQLINDLLDLSRLEANSEPILLNTVDFKVWVPYMVSLVQPGLRQAGLHIRLVIEEDIPVLKTDLSYLEGIVDELLHNAQKYTPSGEDITIEVSTFEPHTPLHTLVMQTHSDAPSSSSQSDAASSRYQDALHTPSNAIFFSDIFNTIADPTQPIFSIAVRNSGTIIPASEYDRIFDKFYRIPRTDPWKYSGTGLGLALLKCRVHTIKGVVSVRSDQTGTTFTIIVPNLHHKERPTVSPSPSP